ncbi:MAG: hypothetical protein WB988_11085 [Candidatus Nitrosopolaris sp.]
MASSSSGATPASRTPIDSTGIRVDSAGQNFPDYTRYQKQMAHNEISK